MKPQSTAGGEKCPIGASGSKVVGGLCVGVILGTDMITNRWKLPLNTVLIPSHLCSWACLAGTSVWTMGRQWRVLTLSGDYENKLAAAIEEIGSIYHGFTVASVEAACLYFSTVALSKALSSAPKTARGFPVTSSCLSACALTAVGANLVNLLFIVPKKKAAFKAITSQATDSPDPDLVSTAQSWLGVSFALTTLSAVTILPFVFSYIPQTRR